MGGYGVLAAAGATLDPAGGLVTRVPGGLLQPFARGGALSASLVAPAVKAVVAFAPAGGAFGAFGADGLAGIKSPLLLIAGDHDNTVDYTSGARAYFDQAVHSNRYLLTFLGGGHALGLGPAPPEMQTDLWNQDWFEDPVWRKDRLIGISLHFITAFLDRYVKDDSQSQRVHRRPRRRIEQRQVGRAAGDSVERTQPRWRSHAVERLSAPACRRAQPDASGRSTRAMNRGRAQRPQLRSRRPSGS